MFNPFRKKVKIPDGVPLTHTPPTPELEIDNAAGLCAKKLTTEELDALIDCVNTREDEGFDVTIARAAIEKLKRK